jgi:hypothetical protein
MAMLLNRDLARPESQAGQYARFFQSIVERIIPVRGITRRQEDRLQIWFGLLEIFSRYDYNFPAVAAANELRTPFRGRIQQIAEPMAGFRRLPRLRHEAPQYALEVFRLL